MVQAKNKGSMNLVQAGERKLVLPSEKKANKRREEREKGQFAAVASHRKQNTVKRDEKTEKR